jgi:arylsulfatase A-like enzyme
MRKGLWLVAVGTVAALAALSALLFSLNRDNPPDISPPSTNPSAEQLETDQRSMVCDFRLDPDEGIHAVWSLASQPCSLGAGWARPMRRGVTTASRQASMSVFLERTEWSYLAMRILGTVEPIEDGRVEIWLNGTLVGTAELSNRWRNVAFRVPPGLLRRDVNEVGFALRGFDSTTDKAGGPSDSQPAMVLRRMVLTNAASSEKLTRPELRQIMEEPAAVRHPNGDPAFALRDTAASVSDPSKPGPRGLEIAQPDIILITLDASRPDHFSCYGYGRPTTPNIDRLAEASLVFTNAFALVPATRFSVPTMVTGLSFINHQVSTDDSMLADEATTLAEHLRGAGYRTACFSATPNNSTIFGLEQGYDEFHQLWTEYSQDESMDPHLLSARAVDWLERNGSSRPVHLQLHYVPPHAPYSPAPRFDLFTDPGYVGPFDGHPPSILWPAEGRRQPRATDLEHMIASYDGNLRAADDAVSQVVKALQARPRWSNTVVLITSDHGEAFFEHGEMDHNKTVYDEMLRVPFILRLPPGISTPKIDLDRLVTLADIVPTLLATASLESDMELDGINLLGGPQPTRQADGRMFVVQTAQRRPTRGLRSSRWKVILTNVGRGELYDLDRDPDERVNLRFDRNTDFLAMAALLVQRFSVDPRLPKKYRRDRVEEKDRKMLEALGYVD